MMKTAPEDNSSQGNAYVHSNPFPTLAVVDIPFKLPDRLFGDNGVRGVNRIRLKCIDCHAGGEPARVVLSGVPTLPENCTTALLKRSFLMDRFDHLRKILLLEPRGYPCQNVNFVFPPRPDRTKRNSAPWQYVIGEQQKIYPLMSGHNTICVATALLECGVIQMQEPISKFVLEAPAGPIEITARCEAGKARSIAFVNPPSFVEHLDVPVVVPTNTKTGDPITDENFDSFIVNVDVAYGGMWYCIVDLDQFRDKPQPNPSCHNSEKNRNKLSSKLRLDPSCGKELCRIGEMIKVACREQYPVKHPTEDYPGCDILAFRDSGITERNANVVIMSNTVLNWEKPESWTAMIDRSPCGTGTSAIMATLYTKGLLKVGETFDHYGILGSKFTGTILGTTTLPDGRNAILPKIEGSACITQYSEVVVDIEFDPFTEGFKVADIW